MLEGIEMFKIYLKYFGWKNYNNKDVKDFHGYAEFTGKIAYEERDEILKIENNSENKDGKNIKIIFFSSAGAEGISLSNITQVHILEPYWNEVRVIQMIGRAIRMCSHVELPEEERHVDVYRYKTIKYNIEEIEVIENGITTIKTQLITDDNKLNTIDYYIESTARKKSNEIQSFLEAIKEVAIDCELFKDVNMEKTKYKCFKFNDKSLFDKNIGPAYKEDILEDMKMDNGLNSSKSLIIKARVIKINGVLEKDIENYNTIKQTYWYSNEYEYIYDYQLHYCVGRIKKKNNLPWKLDNDTYVIDVITIPIL